MTRLGLLAIGLSLAATPSLAQTVGPCPGNVGSAAVSKPTWVLFDLDSAVGAKPDSWLACRQHLHRCERSAAEALLVRRNRPHCALGKMDFAALEHIEQLRTHRIHQPDLHVWVTHRVMAQKSGKDPLDQMRRRRYA